jgi:hypothetical protein
MHSGEYAFRLARVDMRNVFDQYDHPENRLSHALAVCLHEDRALLRGFLAWLGVKPPTLASKLTLVEQSLPGDPPESEEAERNGLPDIIIHDGATWCLLIESKVQAPLTHDQLRRHERTLRRRGFEKVFVLVLTKAGVRVPRDAIALTWSGLYEWLGTTRARTEWSERVRSYLRAAELRLVRDEYLIEGTLTMFDGFPFSPENPYTYGEGKRLLKLAMAELRKDRSLRALGLDPKGRGRGSITGRGGNTVCDFLPLIGRPKGTFTAYPHLTLYVRADHLEVAVTIPNGVVPLVRRRLADLKREGLVGLNAKILRRAKRILSLGAWVQAEALQRHYLGQRSPAITDARLSFKLETSQPRRRDRVKRQPEWIGLFAELLRRKRSNIQFAYALYLPWRTKGIASRESLRLIAESWLAMKPLLDVVRSPEGHGAR